MKKLLQWLSIVSLSIIMVGCGNKIEDSEISDSLGQALNARWVITDENSGKTQIELLLEGINAEIEELEKYSETDEKAFKNQETANSLDRYLNVLSETQELISISIEEKRLNVEEWENLRSLRLLILNELNDSIGISVSEDNEGTLKDLLQSDGTYEPLQRSDKDKIGFSTEFLLDSDFNELVDVDFELVDSVNLGGFTMDVFSNEYRILKLLLFTLEGEEYSSAFSVINSRPTENGYEGKADSSYLTSRFESIFKVLVATIPQETIHFIEVYETDNENIRRTDIIYADEILQSIIDEGVSKIPPKPVLVTSQSEEKAGQTDESKSDDEEPTMEQSNALKSARDYLRHTAFSKKGLFNQLHSEYGEGFTEEAAQYAVDNVITDWKENALESANQYLDLSPMSANDLYNQLVSDYGEQYTNEEAQYAIDSIFN